MHTKRRTSLFVTVTAAVFCALSGCSSGTAAAPVASAIALAVSSNAVSSAPNGSLTSIMATVTRPATDLNAISLSVTGAPAGLTVSIAQPVYGTYGTLIFSSAVNVVPGVYPLTVTATDGATTSNAAVTVTISAIDAVSLTATSTSVLALQDGTVGSTALTVSRSYGNTSAVTITASGLPAGLTAQITQPGTGSSGSVAFATATTPAVAGTYAITLTASDGTATNTAIVNVTVGVAVTVNNVTDTTLGVGGHLQEFMSTNFQPSTYNNVFFKTFPGTTDLAALGSSHIRIQPVTGAIPWVTNSATPAATDWSFTALDQTVQPLLSSGDQSPLFQIAIAPAFLCDSSGNFIDTTANLQLLANYAANLVRYYNTGGFTWGGTHFQSASTHHITWWAIFNEPNLHHLTAAQYVQLYNTLVPAMLAVDPTLQFAALELSGYSGQIQAFLPTLVQPAASGGLNTPVNAVTIHFYPTCNQTATDSALLTATAQFVSNIQYMRTELATRSDLVATQVWITENNVNADYQLTTGLSACNAGQAFVSDARGTSAFFTAWRPYQFSQLGKAGNQALYHWLYEGSNQYGEVNSGSAANYLSYWVDYYLQRTFPWNGSSVGASILRTTTTENTSTVEVLVVRNADNSVALMVSDFALHGTTDNNGAGAPRTVVLDISALGTFTSASQIILDANTSTVNGPATTTLSITPKITVTLGGYGTAFINLKP